MTYLDQITRSMTWLASQKDTVFLGEGLINAGRIYGTLNQVPKNKCIEMPIAENLIAGAAIGLSLAGYRPVVVFQRMDFMLIAADALINHASLLPSLSGGQVKIPLIVRAILGSQDAKFDVGPQHNHDFTHIFDPYIRTMKLYPSSKIQEVYEMYHTYHYPCLIVENKDYYLSEEE